MTDINTTFGEACAISFYNEGISEHGVIICASKEVFDSQLARLKELPHIKILHAGGARVATSLAR